jgi:SAM-dependent methyltransferase
VNPEEADEDLVAEQIAYYEARAHEYDEMLHRSGSYLGAVRHRHAPHDAPDDAVGFDRLTEVLAEFNPVGDVLEIACGTGLWTERLAQTASRITAIDSSPASIALNRERVRSKRVNYVAADIFKWTPEHLYDAVFFGFWLTHVPPGRFEPFFDLVRRCLKPQGRLLFFDEVRLPMMNAWERKLDESTGATQRQLDDGRSFHMVKVFYEPDALEARLRGLGWDVAVKKVSTRFLFGRGG